MRVWFVRHAEPVPGAPGDVGLTAVGRGQAERTAQRLSDVAAPVRVVSSPLARALATAEPIAELLDTPLVVDDRLRERANWGDVPGQPFEEFVASWRASDVDWERPAVAGGRSVREVGHEVGGMLDDLVTDDTDEIVLVSHGGVLQALLAVAADDGPVDASSGPSIGYCSISRFQWSLGAVEMEMLAATDHLTDRPTRPRRTP